MVEETRFSVFLLWFKKPGFPSFCYGLRNQVFRLFVISWSQNQRIKNYVCTFVGTDKEYILPRIIQGMFHRRISIAKKFGNSDGWLANQRMINSKSWQVLIFKLSTLLWWKGVQCTGLVRLLQLTTYSFGRRDHWM